MAPALLFRSTRDNLKLFLLTKLIKKKRQSFFKGWTKQVTKIRLSIRKKRHEDTRKNYMFYVEGGRKKRK